jgi:flagellar hook protein FlgE
MTLSSSLNIGAAGMAANSTELNIVGDNIANANTIGFKGSRAAFEDMLGASLAGVNGQVGLGTRLQAVQKILTQGALTTTGLATDLAIQGQGLFIVKDGAQSYYTRAGQFTLDNEGYMTSLEGLRLQGYQADAFGNVTGSMGDLLVGEATSPPRTTTEVMIRANLDSSAEIVGPFDPLNPSSTSNFSTTTTVYDSLGEAYEVTLYFEKTADAEWTYHAMVDGDTVSNGNPGELTEIAGGTLTFDTDGKLLDSQQFNDDFQPLGATAPQPLVFDFGNAINNGGDGTGGITQFSAPSATTFVSQDGFAAGDLARIAIDDGGNIVGTFTNGQARVLGQVALADFPAPDQLDRIGGNLFAANPAAGQPAIGEAGAGGRGILVAGALEQSNVDLASEFVRMIVAQRSFQANSKTISTADQLLAELVQLKR